MYFDEVQDYEFEIENNIILERHYGMTVLRDDLLLGGTKSRYLEKIMDPKYKGYVYASPVYGGFQIALAGVCRKLGKKAVIFTPDRKKVHKNTWRVVDLGAEVIGIKPGYLNVLQKRAKDFAKRNNYEYLEFGANYPVTIDAISETMRKITKLMEKEPTSIFCAVGSGTLLKGIIGGTDKAKVYGVQVGKEFNYTHKRFTKIVYPVGFEYESKFKSDFPSMPNYDRKALEVAAQLKDDNTLFWNVL